MKSPCVYIMASEKNGTLYIGVTSDIFKRVYQHKEGLIDGFSKKYKTNILVYYEQVGTMEAAISREKQMKEWKRLWKLRAMEEINPDWEDLYYSFRD